LTPTQQHGGIIQGKVIQKTDYGKHTTLDFVNQFGEIVSTIKTDDPQFEEDLPEGTYTLVAIKERATVTTIVSLAADSTTYVEVLFQ
jgi:hypothetical protein